MAAEQTTSYQAGHRQRPSDGHKSRSHTGRPGSSTEHEAAAGAVDGASTIGNQPQSRVRRNPKWIVLGILAICLGGLGSFFLYSQVTDAHQVVAMTKTVHRGEKITAGDLTAVQVGETGHIATVPSKKLSAMVGQVASYDLIKGSLLSPASVGAEQPPGAGHAVVGIKVSDGRAPSKYLQPNTPIRLVVLPDSGAAGPANAASVSGSAEQPKSSGKPGKSAGSKAPSTVGERESLPVISAKVLNTSRVTGGMLLNVELDAKQAVHAASYAAQDRVAVVRSSEH